MRQGQVQASGIWCLAAGAPLSQGFGGFSQEVGEGGFEHQCLAVSGIKYPESTLALDQKVDGEVVVVEYQV